MASPKMLAQREHMERLEQRIPPNGLVENMKPAMGYAVALIVPPGETAGGIIIPDSAKEFALVLVEASEGHFVGNSFVECKALPGARLIPLPDAKMFQSMCLPEKHVIIRLMDVACFEAIGARA